MPNEPIFSKDEYEAKLLLQKPKFQDGVMLLRRKWDVPDDGFTSQGAYDDWHKRICSGKKEEYDGDISRLIKELGLTERWH